MIGRRGRHSEPFLISAMKKWLLTTRLRNRERPGHLVANSLRTFEKKNISSSFYGQSMAANQNGQWRVGMHRSRFTLQRRKRIVIARETRRRSRRDFGERFFCFPTGFSLFVSFFALFFVLLIPPLRGFSENAKVAVPQGEEGASKYCAFPAPTSARLSCY